MLVDFCYFSCFCFRLFALATGKDIRIVFAAVIEYGKEGRIKAIVFDLVQNHHIVRQLLVRRPTLGRSKLVLRQAI